jgi:hypothetical protein
MAVWSRRDAHFALIILAILFSLIKFARRLLINFKNKK